MALESISDSSDSLEISSYAKLSDDAVIWNGREVAKSEESHLCLFQRLSNGKQSCSSFSASFLKPDMSRAPEKSEAAIKGGYDEERGIYVEGSVTWSWGSNNDNKEGKSETSAEVQAQSDPPDTRDREQDKSDK